MSAPLFRWAWREVLRGWRVSLFFILNLALGLTGFIALESYKTSLRDHIDQNRREILGGDLAMSSRREFSEEELRLIRDAAGPGAVESSLYDFFAMAASAKSSRLVLVKAVDANYPLAGSLRDPEGHDIKADEGGVWLGPELKDALDVKPGDHLKLGQADFVVRGFVGEDQTQTFRSAGLAPRLFMRREALSATKLIQFGSTFSRTELFRLPPDRDAEKIRTDIFAQIKDPAVDIETARNASEESGRQLKLLADFLGLVALVALFLAALGAAFIWRFFLQRRVKDVAILRSLGLDSAQAVLLYVIEAGLLGAFAIVPAVVAAQLLIPLLSRLLSVLSPFDLRPVLNLPSVGVGLLLSLGTSFLVTLPFLLRLREIHPAQLFSEERFNPETRFRRPWAFIPAGLALWGLAILQAKSLFIGSLFTGILLGVLALLGGVGWVLLKLGARLRGGPWDVRHGLRSAGRRPAASLGIFVALGLGSLLMNVLPQIKTSLQSEMTVGEGTKIPSLFLFDIQDEQLAGLNDFMSARKLSLIHESALIRARILKVNGQAFERKLEGTGFRTREEESEARFRNRGVNLSYRANLSDSEEVTAGRPFSGKWTEGHRAELSVEQKYAEKLGLHIGDALVFDVQGVEVEGDIINLRKVRWTSFQPNFFILIQDGVLNDAPKTWIAGLPRMAPDAKERLQSDLAAKFPNVSVIDVARTVNELLKVADQMSWALELMAALALATGAVVLFSIARSQVHGRRWELNMLKVLGASPGRVRRYLFAEFGLLVLVASVVGAAFSVLVSYILVRELFDGGFTLDLRWIFGTAGLVTVLGLVVTERACAEVIREKPVNLLRGE